MPRIQRHTAKRIWERLRAFEFFAAVPKRITYDNTKVAVSKIVVKDRRLTQGFLRLEIHYLFDHHCCPMARGNAKGVMEDQVTFTRQPAASGARHVVSTRPAQQG